MLIENLIQGRCTCLFHPAPSALRLDGVEETIRFHLRPEPRPWKALTDSSLPALICLKNEIKADAERDLHDLISAAGADVPEKLRRDEF